jgi:hypothetical protein
MRKIVLSSSSSTKVNRYRATPEIRPSAQVGSTSYLFYLIIN